MGAPKTSSSSTTEFKLGPEQKKVFAQAEPFIEEYGAAPLPSFFPESGVVGFDPREQAGMNFYTQTAAPLASSLGNQSAYTQSNLMNPNFMLNPNQYVDAAARRVSGESSRNLMEDVLPGIRAGAMQAGGPFSAGSSREALTTSGAIGKQQTALTDALADMYFRNYSQGLGVMANQVNQNPALMKSLTTAGDIMAAPGKMERDMQQALLNEKVQRFYAGQEGELELAKAQQLLGLIGMMPGGSGHTSTTGSMPGANPFMQGIGAISSLAGMFGGGGGMGAGALGAAMK